MSASVGGKKKTIVLNLTSMIDICAILIIFLVMGTVVGQEELSVPLGFKFPKSFNKEILETAPQVIVYNEDVEIKFLHQKINLQALKVHDSDASKRLSSDIQKYIEEMPTKVKTSGILLNMIADGKIPYNVIFDVSKYFRENGFQSILFVAEGN